MKVRKPSKKELLELANLESKKSGVEIEQVMEWVENSFISVADDYITDCPGYSGKVVSVVWCGSPSIYNVYIVDSKGKLICLEPELTNMIDGSIANNKLVEILELVDKVQNRMSSIEKSLINLK